jgi:hypothetical protein
MIKDNIRIVFGITFFSVGFLLLIFLAALMREPDALIFNRVQVAIYIAFACFLGGILVYPKRKMQ